MPSGSLGLVPVRRALLSVSDPTGLIELARSLAAHRVELWATAGTRDRLAPADLEIHAAEELTGIGAWFEGRIKTLHPGILGGILAPRTPAGEAELTERKLRPIDLVAVNFYPFVARARERPDAGDLEEFIDIGGVTLARAAAKNHAYVASLTDPSDYPSTALELAEHRGALTAATRARLAATAFERTAAYDRAIADRLGGAGAAGPFPAQLSFVREPLELRYGENPHQAAAAYRLGAPASAMPPARLRSVKGGALSFTNLLDLDTAAGVVGEFREPTAAVVKHATPCGVASAGSIREAIERSVATDPIARYGCAIAVNRPMTVEALEPLHGVFVDLLAAPSFDDASLARLAKRPKVKLVETPPPTSDEPRWETKGALGRLLVQEVDRRPLAPTDLRAVTSRTATPQEIASMAFAWHVVRHAKSNAVVLAVGDRTVGIGSGQTTRIKAVELAVEVAGDRARGSVLASDAFFPFADGIDAAGRAGVSAIVQPGGSVRDPEVIAAADRWKIAMCFTGWRVFRH